MYSCIFKCILTLFQYTFGSQMVSIINCCNLSITGGFYVARFITTVAIEILFPFMHTFIMIRCSILRIILIFTVTSNYFVCFKQHLIHLGSDKLLCIMFNAFFIAYNNVKSYLQYVLINQIYDQTWLHKRRTYMLENVFLLSVDFIFFINYDN